jgi:circadian clock protein KaiC
MHLVSLHKLIHEFKPNVVVLDPIGTLTMAGTVSDTTSMLTRLMDFLKSQQITAVWTSLTSGEEKEKTDVAISSLADTWLLLRDIELGGERNRAIYVLKSRGMAHSNQIREFFLTDQGIELADVYLGPEGVLTGTARKSQEAKETAEAVARDLEIEAKRRKLARKRQVLEARIAAMRSDFEAEQEEMNRVIGEDQDREEVIRQDRQKMAVSRHANGKQPAKLRTR